MSSDPPASDLGAIRGRLAQSAYAMQTMVPSADVARDLLAFIAAYDAQATRLAHMGTYCAYCTAEFPDEAPDTVAQIQQHVYRCQYHPMREVERDRDAMDSQATRYRVALEQAQKTVDAQAARLAALAALEQAARAYRTHRDYQARDALFARLAALAAPPGDSP